MRKAFWLPGLLLVFSVLSWPVLAGSAAPAGQQTSDELLPIFTAYYQRVQQILETMQQVIDVDGPRDEVSTNSDAAALQVRRIVNRLIVEETSRERRPD
jgi:hypothetical protein